MRFRVLAGALAAALPLLIILGDPEALHQTAPTAPPSIAVAGRPEPVFDWAREACEPHDFADAPARAFRAPDGTIRLFASHYVARAMTGPDGDSLRHGCAVAFRGEGSGAPRDYSDLSWLMSPYVLPDGRVFALVHNEFQGHRHPGRCAADAYRPCWENAVTWAISTDGGRTFHAPPAERRVIAALPWRYDGDRDRPGGYFNPSNIVAHEGAWYALVWARPYRDQAGGVCVLRTTRLDDPSAWRAWDGKSFEARFVDPYRSEVEDPKRHLCAPVGTGVFRDAPSSLVRHPESGLFLALQAVNMPDPEGGPPLAGVWVSASPDLLAWSEPRLVWRVSVWRPAECRMGWSVSYPSLIDFGSPTPNFETVSDHPWLYFTRYRLDEDCRIGQDRSLWRVPVTIE